MRAHVVRTAHDPLDVLDLARLEEDVGDGDEERALVDRLDDLLVVLADDDVEVGLSLEEVAHGGKVRAFVDDAISVRPGAEAREHDRLRDRDVLVHHRRAGRRADNAADLIADRHWHLPPALAPGADPAVSPRARVLRHPVLNLRGHRAERVVDQVGRLREDRELGAVVEQLAHAGESAGASAPRKDDRPRGTARDCPSIVPSGRFRRARRRANVAG